MKTSITTKSKNRQAFMDGDVLPTPQNIQISNIDEDDSIEQMFRNDVNNQQHEVKELFSNEKVKSKSDISVRQVKLITKAFYLAKITGMKEIYTILDDFLVLSISKDRKSRLEYVEGLKARIESAIRGDGNIRGQFGK